VKGKFFHIPSLTLSKSTRSSFFNSLTEYGLLTATCGWIDESLPYLGQSC
jgi:hypothetical protein